MPPDDELACFQAALLDALASPDPARSLASLAETAAFADYVAAMEPRMVEVAAALMQKWGKRTRE